MALPERLQGRMADAAPQFHRNDTYTTLAVDADSLIYKVAATTKGLETAKRKLVSAALTLHFLADADTSRLHLTPAHCKKAGRFNVVAEKPYQGNRDPGLDKDGNPKPSTKPELVEPLRYVVGRRQLELPPELEIVFNDVYEADDSVVMECEADPNVIFYSEDKDLDCLRNRKLCQHEMRVLPAIQGLGYLQLKELSRSKKVVGRGPVFFWAQMLMGDQADNIKGIRKANGKLCGSTKTFQLLLPFLTDMNDCLVPNSFSPTYTEQDLARYVLSLYKIEGQNPWPEAWLLWLYRTEKYSFYAHMQHLGLLDDSELGVWLKQQAKLNWFIKDKE
ncbi:hypothetical protein fHeYen301_30 [Yersinia phage fHe-Yen3-01]|uniref:DNA exonuclease n=1 Tax=Yersinia phage fHe-Yen3-01 TaxID=1932893 RepID=A0A1L7DQN9_9CAUD|nr:exonuclease [Yersinia phage fHe-Yen3-01]APU00363.1 hypothetical protein fHeYen301_30 [Yersinia phage fHe-Yen3-01]